VDCGRINKRTKHGNSTHLNLVTPKTFSPGFLAHTE
jgi:hypothetical protein